MSRFEIALLASIPSVLVVFGVTGVARAADGPHAVDRLEPPERGSTWLANESLDYRGDLRPSFGYAMTYARRPLVVDGTSPVADLVVAHLGATVVAMDTLRFGLDLPFQVYAGGASTPSLRAPERDEGIGDVRFSTDARLFGARTGGTTGALGVQLWVPTGQETQFTSDGIFRMRPRFMVAGAEGAFVWAAQGGVHFRRGTEITLGGAAGLRPVREIVIGPEVFASTPIADPFATRGTPIEALLGARWHLQNAARVGAGAGVGLGEGVGAPAFRASVVVDWVTDPDVAAEAKTRRDQEPVRRKPAPDRDHDRVPDDVDACPDVAGVPTHDPKTHGCPPDTDGDGIDDLADACPTQVGVATGDPATHGCPDRDRDKDGIPNEQDACPDNHGKPDVDPRRHGCPRAFVRGEKVVVLDPIAWKGTTAELVSTGDAGELLTAVLAALLELPAVARVRIEGHVDSASHARDKRTSGARAEALATWLVEHGFARERIAVEDVGAQRPLETNETEVGRAENRRIEIHVVR